MEKWLLPSPGKQRDSQTQQRLCQKNSESTGICSHWPKMEHFDATEWVDHITYIKRYLDSQIHAEDLVLEDTWEQTWVFVFVLFCFS